MNPADPVPSFSVVRGNPTPEELAAVTAVIEGLLEEQGVDALQESGGGMSAWQRSQRPMRTTLSPGYGAWRSFS